MAVAPKERRKPPKRLIPNPARGDRSASATDLEDFHGLFIHNNKRQALRGADRENPSGP